MNGIKLLIFLALAATTIVIFSVWVMDDQLKTIALQQRTIDSLKEVNDFLLETGDTLTIRMRINGEWMEFKSGIAVKKGDKLSISYPVGVLKSGWPQRLRSDSLKWKPMQRAEDK
jgi:hypothetical protein